MSLFFCGDRGLDIRKPAIHQKIAGFQTKNGTPARRGEANAPILLPWIKLTPQLGFFKFVATVLE
jgi:hypothetical protein